MCVNSKTVQRLAMYVGVLWRSVRRLCGDLTPQVLFISRLRGLSQSTLASRWWRCRISAASAVTSLLSAVTPASCSSDLSHHRHRLVCHVILCVRFCSFRQTIKTNVPKNPKIMSNYWQHFTKKTSFTTEASERWWWRFWESWDSQRLFCFSAGRRMAAVPLWRRATVGCVWSDASHREPLQLIASTL